jgi:hypothetical protein
MGHLLITASCEGTLPYLIKDLLTSQWVLARLDQAVKTFSQTCFIACFAAMPGAVHQAYRLQVSDHFFQPGHISQE